MAKEIIGEKESKSVRNPTLFSDAKGAAFDLDIKFEKRIANLAKTKSHYSDETGSDISIEAAIELPRLASFSLGDNMNSNGRRTFGRSKFGTNFRNRNNGGGYRNGNYKRNSYNGKNRFGGNKRLRR
ncbi:hypothetical protein MHBO_004885 [Bonamia ostreae]|uniref:Uncharacterized protein n=1 Tax=Bonamia ostreae TaxID=126728 RepID=A0ABV2AUH4_9EUKA